MLSLRCTSPEALWRSLISQLRCSFSTTTSLIVKSKYNGNGEYESWTGNQSESVDHYNTKHHLAEQFLTCDSIDILKVCSTKSNPRTPSIEPYWDCNNLKLEPKWMKNWNDVEVEKSWPPYGKFDVALLDKHDGNSRLKAAVEVLVSSPMTSKKLKHLEISKIPWLEVKAEPQFYSQLTGYSPPWTPEHPLLVTETSDGPWTCDACKEAQSDIRLDRLAAVVDFFYRKPSKFGSGWRKRIAYGLYKKHLEMDHSKLKKSHSSSKKTIYFLAASPQLVLHTQSDYEPFDQPTKLVLSTHPSSKSLLDLDFENASSFLPDFFLRKTISNVYNKRKILEEKTSNLHKKALHGEEDAAEEELAMLRLQEAYLKDVLLEIRENQNVYVDVPFLWPGKSVEAFCRDKHVSIDPSSIRSIPSMHATISRKVRISYKWDVQTRSWNK